MVDKQKIMRCIERWGEVGLLDAIKEENLNQEESDFVLDLVMEKVTRDVEKEVPRKIRKDDQFQKIAETLAALRTQMSGLSDALNILANGMDQLLNGPNYVEATHCGHPGQAQTPAPESVPAETKIVNLANRRPPSRTPPESRKGA